MSIILTSPHFHLSRTLTLHQEEEEDEDVTAVPAIARLIS